MLKKLKKLIPEKEKILEKKIFSFFNKNIHQKHYLWDFEKKSIAIGIFAGTIGAFIALPVQSLIAILLCLVMRGNILIAIPTTFISNPLTYAPLYWICYKVGNFFYHNKNHFNFSNIHWNTIFHNLNSIINILIPTLIGGVLIGIIVGFILSVICFYMMILFKK